MNKIEQIFYDSLESIILSDTEKILVSDYGEEIKYKFSETGYSQDRRLNVTRPAFPQSKFILDTNFSVYTNEDEYCEIKGYKPDFMIKLGDGGYAIEIDGYEWHEKTKEQAINDRKKDRAYIKAGYIPVRFLGSEIYHDAKKCVEDFIELLITNELSLFNRDSVMKIMFREDSLEEEVEELSKCVFEFGTISPLYIKDHKKIKNPIKFAAKNEV